MVAVAVSVMASAGVAFGFDEPNNATETHSGQSCYNCHVIGPSGLDCTMCHFTVDATRGKGPHGLYTKATDRCSTCHGVHVAAGSNLLTRGSTTASCNVCHDGTGGRGVYRTVYQRTGAEAAGRHRIDTATVVPGGSATTGDAATMVFRGENGTLGCTDCHSPHDSNTVAAFALERMRSTIDTQAYHQGYDGLQTIGIKTNRLLRSHPGDSETTVTVYGSDWCLGCHAGRASGGPLHNHPVDSRFTTATPFYYDKVALLASDAATSATTTGTLSLSNRGYLMVYPRTVKQGTHKPICQQCHEDSRDAGQLSADGTTGDAATYTPSFDGTPTTGNPRFQNFPHETYNRRLLVETDDDLCLNCHPVAVLP
jgi:predicted CXXCH cytochrome family protein